MPSELSTRVVERMRKRQAPNVAPKPPKVFITVPYYRAIMRVELARFLMAQTAAGNLRHYPFFEGRPHCAARNTICKEFLENRPEYTHLLQIDTDVVPPPNVLELAQLDLDVVSSLAFSYQEGVPFALALKKVTGGYQQLAEIPAGKLLEVDATGTGCVMIHRRVLEAVPPPWFEFRYDRWGMLALGEDFDFSAKVKAAGFKVYTHSGYLSSHFAEIDLLQVNSLLCKVQAEGRAAC